MQGWANAGSAWSICTSHAGFGDRLGACSYNVVWTELNAIVAVVGGTYLAFQGGAWVAVTALTYLGTQNPGALAAVIGGDPEYENFAIENSYTYFHLPDWLYTAANVVGLGQAANDKMIANVIDAGQAVIQVSEGGPGTTAEVGQIMNSGLYVQVPSSVQGILNFYNYQSPIPIIKP